MLEFYPPVESMLENKEEILSAAEAAGLNLVETSKTYSVRKVTFEDSSQPSPVVIKGTPFLVGQKDKAWLYFEGFGIYTWFKTSPVKSCVLLSNGSIKVVTQNSVYILSSEN